MEEPDTTNNDDERPILSHRKEIEFAVESFLSSPECDSAQPRDFAVLKPRLESFLAQRFGEAVLSEDQLTYTQIGPFARDYGSVIFFNALHLARFRKIPLENRALFLPHCLQNRKQCLAEEHPHFSRCVACGACDIGWLTELAREFGYSNQRIYIVGGGSGIPRLVRQDNIQAVLGLACFAELASYLESFRSEEGPLPSQMVQLTKWGCRNTEFDRAHAREVITSSMPQNWSETR